jgi:hypothetical protein
VHLPLLCVFDARGRVDQGKVLGDDRAVFAQVLCDGLLLVASVQTLLDEKRSSIGFKSSRWMFSMT